jgi:hypothetical protein
MSEIHPPCKRQQKAEGKTGSATALHSRHSGCRTRQILRQIHKVNTTMHIRCYARAKCTNLHGYISGYSWVWYFPGDLANILSLSHVKEKYRVTFNSALDTCFHVHTKGNILKFCEAMQRHFTLTLENSTRTPLCS